MSIALRRKMFKLGGSTNTHGMGLTSGLKMNKGGKVTEMKSPVVMGPDNKPREAHYAGLLAGAAQLGRGALSFAAPGLQSLIRAGRGGLPGLGQFITRGVPTAKGAAGSGLPVALKAPGFFRQAGRTGLLGLGALSGASPIGLALAALNTDKDSPRILRGAEATGEFLANISPIGGLVSGADFLFGKEGQPTRSLTELFGLSEKKGVEVDTSKADKIAKIKEKTKEELKAENDQRVQEYYEKLGGEGVDKFAALGAGLTAAAPALLEEDYGAAAQRFQEGIQPEVERDRQIRQAAATLAIGDEQAEDAADRELRATLLATGDTDAYTRITKVMDAEEELGIGNVEGLPVKGNNKIDTKKLRRGRIYTDLTSATKAKYVVIDKGGMDHYTNSAEEAKQLVELT